MNTTVTCHKKTKIIAGIRKEVQEEHSSTVVQNVNAKQETIYCIQS